MQTDVRQQKKTEPDLAGPASPAEPTAQSTQATQAKPAGGTLTVGEAANQVGLTVYTLRWYEQEGLVAPVGRDSAGRRRYTSDDLNWLVLLTRLRRTGMPVRDMRRYAELARQGDHTLGARRELFEAHRDRVLARMAELEEDLKVLNFKIEVYGEMERGR